MHGTANIVKTKAKRQPKDKRQKVRVHRYVRKAQRNVKKYMQSIGQQRRLKMPKYEVTRSYTVDCVATTEAESADQAKILAFNFDGIHWKE